jgi:hypothetical protein
MSDKVKFITVEMGGAFPKTIAIDNIASVEPYGMNKTAQITLKEVKDGNNVILFTTANYDFVMNALRQS